MREQDMREIVAAVLKKLHGPNSNDTLLASAQVAGETPSFSVSQSGFGVSDDAPAQVILPPAGHGEMGQGETGLALEDVTLSKAPCAVTAPNVPEIIKEFSGATAARLASGKVGCRPPFGAYIRFLADHARSKNTVFKEVPEEWLVKNGLFSIQTTAEDKNIYLTRPDLGRMISNENIALLKKRYAEPKQILVILSDGLSTDALLANYEEILPPLMKGLDTVGLTVFEPFFLRYGRVKAEDVIGQALGAEAVLMLVGERPGLGQSESMSCYAVYSPTATTIESDRTVISNIHRGGIPPVEAAAVIVELAQNMIKHKASGLQLNRKLEAE